MQFKQPTKDSEENLDRFVQVIKQTLMLQTPNQEIPLKKPIGRIQIIVRNGIKPKKKKILIKTLGKLNVN